MALQTPKFWILTGQHRAREHPPPESPWIEEKEAMKAAWTLISKTFVLVAALTSRFFRKRCWSGSEERRKTGSRKLPDPSNSFGWLSEVFPIEEPSWEVFPSGDLGLT